MNIEIEGTITLEDYEPEHDKTSKFSIASAGDWFQWGATTDRLCQTVNIVEAMQNALTEQ